MVRDAERPRSGTAPGGADLAVREVCARPGCRPLPPGRLLNCTPLIVFCPKSALNWILAAPGCALIPAWTAAGPAAQALSPAGFSPVR